MPDDDKQEPLPGICEITVEGFKSLRDRTTVEIRPLTVLAGANSSGKSSIMQPLLLIKQTMEDAADPGTFRLDGPEVSFTHAEELLHGSARGVSMRWSVQIRLADGFGWTGQYGESASGSFEIESNTAHYPEGDLLVQLGMTMAELSQGMPAGACDCPSDTGLQELLNLPDHVCPVAQWRCFITMRGYYGLTQIARYGEVRLSPTSEVQGRVYQLLHVPGVRKTPSRRWPSRSAERHLSGPFEEYVPSLLLRWQDNEPEQHAALSRSIEALGLAKGISARRLDAASLEVLVRRRQTSSDDNLRRRQTSSDDNLADVGFGVSQVLPVLVALLAAEPGQLVYLEQPELHLHPAAQVALAGPLVKAANRGVRVVAETHSDLLLLAIQTAVARGEIDTKDAILHWFERDDEGVSHVRSAELDKAGAFGDWPEDFGKVRLDAESEYLDLAERTLAEAARG